MCMYNKKVFEANTKWMGKKEQMREKESKKRETGKSANTPSKT